MLSQLLGYLTVSADERFIKYALGEKRFESFEKIDGVILSDTSPLVNETSSDFLKIVLISFGEVFTKEFKWDTSNLHKFKGTAQCCGLLELEAYIVLCELKQEKPSIL
jgi:hypothetical protein